MLDEITKELLTRLLKLVDGQVGDGTDLLDTCTDISAVTSLVIHSGLGVINEDELLQYILLQADPFKAMKISEWYMYVTESVLPLCPSLKICTLIRHQWPEALSHLIENLEPTMIKTYENGE